MHAFGFRHHAVLERGRLTYFDDLDEAIWTHERNLGIQRKPVTVP